MGWKDKLAEMVFGTKRASGETPAEEMDVENIDRPLKMGEVHKLGRKKKSKAFTKGAEEE